MRSMNRSITKVLVVEDDFLAQMVAKLLLEQLACEVDVAKSEEEALEKTSIYEYHLIFMDIGLGTSNGFSVTNKIKENSKNLNTPVVALTAHHTVEYQQQAEAVGMVAFITKPLEMNTVNDLLSKYTAINQ